MMQSNQILDWLATQQYFMLKLCHSHNICDVTAFLSMHKTLQSLSDILIQLCPYKDIQPVMVLSSYSQIIMLQLRTQLLSLLIDLEIIQPRVETKTFDESASSVQLMCTLNTDIPPNVTVVWTHNNILAMTTPPNEVITAGNTTILIIGNPQPSDDGLYRCSFQEMGILLVQRSIFLGQFYHVQL